MAWFFQSSVTPDKVANDEQQHEGSAARTDQGNCQRLMGGTQEVAKFVRHQMDTLTKGN